MARASRNEVIPATPQQVWEVIADPHHLPRWWPGVKRMESVSEASWTQVHQTKKGRPVRVDFSLVDSDPPLRRRWEQAIEGTPFERVLRESVTEVALEPHPDGTRVTIEQRQKLRGYSRTGSLMMRRATNRQLTEALAGLRRAFGAEDPPPTD